MALSLLLMLAACDQGAVAPQAARPVTLKISLARTGLHAASDVPRVEVHVYSCDVSQPCTTQSDDAAIVEVGESGRLTGGECEEEGQGCELVFTPQQPSRTLWLPDGRYALTAAAYLDGSGAPAYCNEPVSFTVGAAGDSEVLVVMSDDCPESELGGDATIASLVLTEDGEPLVLEPEFQGPESQEDGMVYEVMVSAGAVSVTLSVEPSDENATVMVEVGDDVIPVDGGVYEVTLGEEETVITITVTAEDGVTKLTTLVTVVRTAAEPASWRAEFGAQADVAFGPMVARAFDVAVDGEGNVYVVGVTNAGIEGGSIGRDNEGCDYCEDAFLAKFDKYGARLWVYQFGSEFDDRATRVVVADDGTVLVGGETHASDWSDATASMLSGPKLFVRAFSADFGQESHEPSWTHLFGLDSENTLGALAVDGNGFVHAAFTSSSKLSSIMLLTVEVESGETSGDGLRELPVCGSCFGAMTVTAMVPTGTAREAGEPQGLIIAGAMDTFDDGPWQPFVVAFQRYSDEALSASFSTAYRFAFGSVHLDQDQNIILTGVTDTDLEDQAYLNPAMPFLWTLNSDDLTTIGITYFEGGISPWIDDQLHRAVTAFGPHGRVANFDACNLGDSPGPRS